MNSTHPFESGIEGLIEEGDAFKRLSAIPASRARRFHLCLALAFLFTALVGFGPSYSTKIAHGHPSLVLHVHAVLFTGWLVLLVVQSALVRSRRLGLHKRLGIAGAVLATTMLPMGVMTALESARLRGATPESLRLLMLQFGALFLFGTFVALAIGFRRRSQVHRRMIVLATVSIIPAAIVRLPLIGGSPVVALILSTLFVVAGAVHDRRTTGRAHPVYVWGGVAILVSAPLRVLLGQTGTWQSFARLLVG